MLKKERLLKILEMTNLHGIITVNQIIESLHVSDMTVRRDLDELDKSGKIIRIHGGAQSISHSVAHELSHSEKLDIQIKEKEEIGKTVAALINEGDTIFLGPGTTIELLAKYLLNKKIRVVTNNYSAFEILKHSESIDIILIGGNFRKNTGAFVGSITNKILHELKFTKAFISANGVYNNAISTYTVEEGECQKLVLDNSRTKFILADSRKLNKEDFYHFYDLSDMDYLVTDQLIPNDTKNHYEQYIKIIVAESDL